MQYAKNTRMSQYIWNAFLAILTHSPLYSYIRYVTMSILHKLELL